MGALKHCANAAAAKKQQRRQTARHSRHHHGGALAPALEIISRNVASAAWQRRKARHIGKSKISRLENSHQRVWRNLKKPEAAIKKTK